MGSCDEADTAPERGPPGGSDIAYAWFLYGCRDLFLGIERLRKRGSQSTVYCSVVVGGEGKSILPLKGKVRLPLDTDVMGQSHLLSKGQNTLTSACAHFCPHFTLFPSPFPRA